MCVALGSLASAQATSTKLTATMLACLLNYAVTHPDAVLRYNASDMIIHVHGNVSYLSKLKARSRVGGHFFLSSKSADESKQPATPPPNNGALYTVSVILKNGMSPATESELAGLFHDTKDATPLRVALWEMGHPEPATPIQTNNSCATGITNRTTQQRRKSKAVDTQFYWIQYCVRQGHYLVYRGPGSNNLANYFTKHHLTCHHRLLHPIYLQVAIRSQSALSANSLTFFSKLRFLHGCVKQNVTHSNQTIVKPVSAIKEEPNDTTNEEEEEEEGEGEGEGEEEEDKDDELESADEDKLLEDIEDKEDNKGIVSVDDNIFGCDTSVRLHFGESLAVATGTCKAMLMRKAESDIVE